MIEIFKLEVSRDTYDIKDAADSSITVGELIDELRHLDEDAKIVFSNDNGYTYGIVKSNVIDSEWVKTKKEIEDETKRDLEMESLTTDLADLKWGNYYALPEDKLSEEEYATRRAKIFEEYGISEAEYFRWCNS